MIKAQTLKGVPSGPHHQAGSSFRKSRDELRDTVTPGSVLLAEDCQTEEVLDLVRSQNTRSRQQTQGHDSKQSSKNNSNRVSKLSSRTRNGAQHVKMRKSGSQPGFEPKRRNDGDTLTRSTHSRNSKLKLSETQSRETLKPVGAGPLLKRATSGRNTIGSKKPHPGEQKGKLVAKVHQEPRNCSLDEFPADLASD